MLTPNPALLWGAYTDPDPVTDLADTPPCADLATQLEDLCAHLRALRTSGGTLTASRAVTDDAGLVDALIGAEHLLRWAGALRTELIAELDRRRPGDEPTYVSGDTPHLGSRWAPDELGLALSTTRLTAKTLLARAERLTRLFPATLGAWRQGRLDEARVLDLLDLTAVLPDDLAIVIEARALERAEGKTRPQWRALLRRLIARLDPDGDHRRHTTARTTRAVTYHPLPDGMGSLWARLSAVDTEAVWQTLCRLAKALGPDDPRTMDQRRADLLVDLCTGRLTLTDTTAVTQQVSAALAQVRDTYNPDTSADTDSTVAAGISTEDTGGSGTQTGAAAAHADPTESATAPQASADAASAHPGSGDADEAAAATALVDDASEASNNADSGDTRQQNVAEGTARCECTGSSNPVDLAGSNRPEPPGGSGGSPPPEQRPGEGTAHPLGEGAPAFGEAQLAAAVEAVLAHRPDPRTVGRGKPLIQVVVGYDTLTGASDAPAELVGYGPIPSGLAREAAADGVWKRLVTDPLSGALLDHGRTLYRPPAALRDFVTARDQTCRFPTCNRRVLDGDLDHHQRAADCGPTCERNLHGLCKAPPHPQGA